MTSSQQVVGLVQEPPVDMISLSELANIIKKNQSPNQFFAPVSIIDMSKDKKEEYNSPHVNTGGGDYIGGNVGTNRSGNATSTQGEANAGVLPEGAAEGRKSRIILVVCAVIGAIGAIVAAWLGGAHFHGKTNDNPGESSPVKAAPKQQDKPALPDLGSGNPTK